MSAEGDDVPDPGNRCHGGGDMTFLFDRLVHLAYVYAHTCTLPGDFGLDATMTGEMQSVGPSIGSITPNSLSCCSCSSSCLPTWNGTLLCSSMTVDLEEELILHGLPAQK